MPAAPMTAPKKKKKKRKSAHEVDEMEEWKKSRQLLKPKDQLELSDAELKEIIPKVLQAISYQIPTTIVQFSWAEGEFVPLSIPNNLLVVFDMKGTYIHKETDEAKNQMLEMGVDPNSYFITAESISVQMGPETIAEDEEEEAEEDAEGPKTEDETEEGAEGEDKPPEPPAEPEPEPEQAQQPEPEAPRPGRAKKLTNQFNFCERAALTYNNPTRSQATQTIPPPMSSISDNVLQWVIYDSYLEDFAAQEAEKERQRELRDKDKLPVGKPVKVKKKVVGKKELDEALQKRLYEAWKTLERMINLNTYNDIAKDYRYWDDPSDQYRDEEGTLLPLWKFSYQKTKKHTITDIAWNPHYYDLFAVGFGFLDFAKPLPDGCICFFTLKNPSYPDYICMTESGVMCLDVHKNYPYMIVVGLYDGNILIYNIQSSCSEPVYKNCTLTQKHSGSVWEIKWAPNLPDGELNFFSIANDGKVNNWTLMQNALSVSTIITLYLERDTVTGPDGTLVRLKGCPSCLVFHPKNPQIYMVGTEEGFIYKCSTQYSSGYMVAYNAHHLPVYRIDYNRFNSDIFISCSADWRIKIWEDGRLEPLFVFDIGTCAGDVHWAPYSSTVFAAVANDGKVYVFDINVNKYKPICIQAVVSKRKFKLTRLAFNEKLPIIVVGDDKGTITSLKLSPNLRLMCKPPKKQQHLDQNTLQIMKLDKLLSLVREPIKLKRPPDGFEAA